MMKKNGSKQVRLAVNADDFGFSKGITDGIIYCYKNGIVRSTSLMVNAPAAAYAAKLAKHLPGLSVGLHFVFESQKFTTVSNNEVESVLHTLDNQYSKFIKLFGKMPDHIDVHQGLPQNRKIVFAYQVFVSRHKLLSRFDNTHNMIYDFYGQKKFRDTTSDIQVKYLKQILNSLPGNKPNLLVCHPGFSNRNLKDPYNYERRIEVDTLTSSEILSLINSKSIIVEAFNSLTTFRKVNP